MVLVVAMEIFQTMICLGKLTELGWAIIDEQARYLRDKERAVVRKESLTLLPNNVAPRVCVRCSRYWSDLAGQQFQGFHPHHCSLFVMHPVRLVGIAFLAPQRIARQIMLLNISIVANEHRGCGG